MYISINYFTVNKILVPSKISHYITYYYEYYYSYKKSKDNLTRRHQDFK